MCLDSPFEQWLPFRGVSFKALREEGRFYVDKSRIIAGIAAHKRKFLFTRSAGFGKSLLLSTFEALFRDGSEAFHGLDAEHSWRDRTYDVVRLDFSEVAGFATDADFRELFDRLLVRGFARAGFEPEGGSDAVMQLGEWLRSRPARSLVLLIDDYDAPLAAAFGDGSRFKAVWMRLDDFFIRTKSCAEVFRFFFMTGEAKFTWAGPFGGFNDVIEVTADPEFAGLVGFTEAELCEGFEEGLAAVAGKLGLAVDEVVERLRERCGGYCFDEACSVRLFRPASVMAFLREAEQKGALPALEGSSVASRLLPLIRAKVREAPAWNQGAGISLRLSSRCASPGLRAWGRFSFRQVSFRSTLAAGAFSSSAARIRRQPRSLSLLETVARGGGWLEDSGRSSECLPECFLYALYQEERRNWRAVDTLQ